jgi:hypothetical protein
MASPRAATSPGGGLRPSGGDQPVATGRTAAPSRPGSPPGPRVRRSSANWSRRRGVRPGPAGQPEPEDEDEQALHLMLGASRRPLMPKVAPVGRCWRPRTKGDQVGGLRPARDAAENNPRYASVLTMPMAANRSSWRGRPRAPSTATAVGARPNSRRNGDGACQSPGRPTDDAAQVGDRGGEDVDPAVGTRPVDRYLDPQARQARTSSSVSKNQPESSTSGSSRSAIPCGWP